jgi:fatty-acyl-CoA synthase
MEEVNLTPMQLRNNTLVTRDWGRAIGFTQRLLSHKSDAALARLIHKLAGTRAGAEPALIGTNESLSYAALSAQANRYARWALGEGFAAGDVVALDLTNRPEYVAIWLGLTQVGCIVALLNTNLGPGAKEYCLRTAGAKHAIASTNMPEIASLSGDPLGEGERRPPRANDRALLIYTSGTTGMPKAVNITHARILEWSGWFAGMMEATSSDRLYNCLPLYHSVGGIVAIGSMLAAGGAVIVRERFSASRFWPDVAASNATIVQYIGELCRYSLATPVSENDTEHRVRLAVGNGLSKDVWTLFQERFAIPRILEFYAASEGAVSFTNCEGKVGSLGRVPAFLRARFPVALVECDQDTGALLRTPDGHCLRVPVGKSGEAIAQLSADGKRSGTHFDGYTDSQSTDAKILRNVFEAGDRWYRTGDLLRQDEEGYYYFVDRLGDTFRWKGENVSTTEVALVARQCQGVLDAAVYGVSIPGADGKTGMAALVVEQGVFDFATLRSHLKAQLPAYARPMFVRLCPALPSTGTFRLRKTELAQQGYAKSTDPVWFNDERKEAFLPYDGAALTARP